MRVIAVVAIVCGCLFVFGFLMADRVRITVQKKGATHLDVIVTVPSVTPQMHTLFLEACAAEFFDDGPMACSADGWYTNSAHPIREDQRQYPFPLKRVPRGWLMFSAAVVDFDGATLASGNTRMVR